MKVDFKKLLLAGTAVVAVSSFATQSQAADLTLTAGDVWADGGGADAGPAAAGDNINVATFTLTVQNDGVSDDGGGVATFTLGAVTGTTGDLVFTSDAASGDVTATVSSVTLTGAGDVTVQNLNADDSTVAVTVTNDLTMGGALVIDNAEASASDAVSLAVGDDLTVTGTTTITAGDFANATAALDVNGDAAFTGAVTVTGGTVAATADSTVSIAGNATFTGGLTLTDGAAGQAILTLDGLTVAQTVTGNIAGNGDINVQNAAGVTFNGTVTSGTVLIENGGAALNSAATFKNTVASAITLGAAGTGTNTATFDIGTTDFTVTGTVDGAIAGETNNVVVSGGSGTLTQATAWGGVTGTIDSITISGTGTELDSNAAITATTITVGSGAILDGGAGLITAAVANSGTINLTGTGGITGNITGTGTLDVDANASVTGGIVQGSTTVAEGSTLTVVGGAARAVTTDILLEDAASDGTDAGLTFDNGAFTTTVTGDITTGVDGEGLITFADDAGATLAIVGNIGTSSAAVGALAIAGGAAQTFTTTGDLYVDAITANAVDTIRFLGDGAAQTVSGTITGGILAVGDGTTETDVTFSGALAGLASLTVNDDSIAYFNANATTTGAFSADAATVQITNGATLTAATQTDADVTQFNVVVNQVGGGAQTNGTYVLSGDAVNLANDTVHFVVKAGSAPLTTGASVLNNVFQGNAAATIAGSTTTDNSFLYGFTLVADGNNVDVTIAQDNSIESAATSSAGAVVGEVLMTELAASTDTEINLAQGNLAAAETQEEVNNVLESTLPTIDGGAVVGALNVSNRVAGVTSTRLAALRDGEASSGIAAGNMGEGLRGWVQAFGQTAEQDRRDGIDGYDADTYGVAIGADGETVQGGTVGVALSYGNTDVDSKVGFGGQTDVDSYQISVYGDAPLSDLMYVEGMVGYAWNDIETTRYNVGGIAGTNANGDFDANQFNAYAEIGRDYAQGGGLTLTPHALANWTYFDADDYTETGAGGLNLTVDNESMNVFELGVGVDAAWDIQNSNGSSVKPVLTAGARYDLVGDEVEATSTFTGGGGAFSTQGMEPGRTTLNLGAGVTYYTLDNWELSAEYDFEYKADYDAHSGQVRAAFHF